MFVALCGLGRGGTGQQRRWWLRREVVRGVAGPAVQPNQEGGNPPANDAGCSMMARRSGAAGVGNVLSE